MTLAHDHNLALGWDPVLMFFTRDAIAQDCQWVRVINFTKKPKLYR